MESLLISNASSHILYSHNLLSLLNKSLISLVSAEWTEMLEICICSCYRSPILLSGLIVNNWFLSFSNVSIWILTFQAPSSKFLGTVQQGLPETLFVLLSIKWGDVLQSWLYSSYTSAETVSQAQELFPQQQSQPHSRAAGNAHTQMLIGDSAPVWLWISSLVSHLPDKYSSQNSAPSLLGPL